MASRKNLRPVAVNSMRTGERTLKNIREPKLAKQSSPVDEEEDREERNLMNFQKLHLGHFIRDMLRREWFKGYFDPPLDLFTVKLLFCTYWFGITGNPISKKSAWNLIGVADIKTA